MSERLETVGLAANYDSTSTAAGAVIVSLRIEITGRYKVAIVTKDSGPTAVNLRFAVQRQGSTSPDHPVGMSGFASFGNGYLAHEPLYVRMERGDVAIVEMIGTNTGTHEVEMTAHRVLDEEEER